jgi:hypothetical protein
MKDCGYKNPYLESFIDDYNRRRQQIKNMLIQ